MIPAEKSKLLIYLRHWLVFYLLLTKPVQFTLYGRRVGSPPRSVRRPLYPNFLPVQISVFIPSLIEGRPQPSLYRKRCRTLTTKRRFVWYARCGRTSDSGTYKFVGPTLGRDGCPKCMLYTSSDRVKDGLSTNKRVVCTQVLNMVRSPIRSIEQDVLSSERVPQWSKPFLYPPTRPTPASFTVRTPVPRIPGLNDSVVDRLLDLVQVDVRHFGSSHPFLLGNLREGQGFTTLIDL